MRLTDPIDFELLDALADGKRNNAANLAIILDRERSYINTRLPILEDYGLVEKVGPAERSGLYVITERGRKVLRLYQQQGPDADFDGVVASG